MTFGDEVLEYLTSAGLIAQGHEAVAGVFLPRLVLPVRPWTGDRPNSGSVDCRKGESVLRARGGSLSCIEVEVVRLARRRWRAGWVQGYPCGATSWSRWQWPRTLAPEPVVSLNDAIQVRLERNRTFRGHPDVAVTDGVRVAYLECKMRDKVKYSQINWLSTAFEAGLIDPESVALIQGIPG
jgi:hypothetical protein